MWILQKLKVASRDESGAVTVDWVVLAAALVVLGSGLVSVISPSLTNASNYISNSIVSSAD